MRHGTLRAFVPALALALGALLTGTPATAQQTQSQGQQSGTPAQAEDVPQEELDRYAKAYLEITRLRQSLQQEMQNAGSEEERASVRESANQEMASVLRDHDLSVQRYREITNVLNSDQEQRQEFTALVQEMRSDDGDGGSSGSGG